MRDKIKEIKKIIEKQLDDPSHNIDHVLRVYNLCMHLAEKEKNIDFEVLQAATLLHDIAGQAELNDKTGKTDHAIIGSKMAESILRKLKFKKDKIAHIKECILSHRYKTNNKPKTIEAKILFDADKLDALGAIGVARAFVWVGKNKASIYKKLDINEYKRKNLTSDSGRIKDKTKHSPQIEFETKIKYLPKKLYTQKAIKIAKERLNFQSNFLKRLEKEIKGNL